MTRRLLMLLVAAVLTGVSLSVLEHETGVVPDFMLPPAAEVAYAHGQDAGQLQPRRVCNWEHRGEERILLDGQRKVWIFWRCVCPYAEPPHGCHWQHIWTREIFNHATRRGHYHGNYIGMDLIGLRIHAVRKLELHDGVPTWHTYLWPQNVWCRAGRH